MLNAVLAAEEVLHPLVLPNWVFPVIAFVVFIALGLMVFSFRDVFNRHSHKSSQSNHGGHH
jgi:uncharacterized membrane-anchored protein YhcB (DUF1043 family)